MRTAIRQPEHGQRVFDGAPLRFQIVLIAAEEHQQRHTSRHGVHDHLQRMYPLRGRLARDRVRGTGFVAERVVHDIDMVVVVHEPYRVDVAGQPRFF